MKRPILQKLLKFNGIDSFNWSPFVSITRVYLISFFIITNFLSNKRSLWLCVLTFYSARHNDGDIILTSPKVITKQHFKGYKQGTGKTKSHWRQKEKPLTGENDLHSKMKCWGQMPGKFLNRRLNSELNLQQELLSFYSNHLQYDYPYYHGLCRACVKNPL